MAATSYTVIPVPGLKQSNRRAIAFLRSGDERRTNAELAFQRLGGNIARQVRSRFDHWIDGFIYPRYFHGWPNNMKYKDCWVFKWKEGRQCHRFYGFLCHPRPFPGFNCAFWCHMRRRTNGKQIWPNWATRIRSESTHLSFAAIKKAFPDTKESTNQWLN